MIVATCERVNILSALSRRAGCRYNAAQDSFVLGRILNVDNVVHRDASLIFEPIKSYIRIAKGLGISSRFCYVMTKTPSTTFRMEDPSCRLFVCSKEEQRVLQRIDQVFPQEQLTTLARQTGALKRQRKITPMGLLGALCLVTFHGSCSLRMAAMFTGILSGCVISKQALAQRVNQLWLLFFSKVLGHTFLKTAMPIEAKATGIFNSFSRVLVNDSTKLALPKKLAPYFPGPSNQSRKGNAMISLQATVDLLIESFVDFSIHPYNYNDQRAAPDILEIISAGDLIIRDLGYFVPRVFRAIIDKLAYFLSRYHHGTDLFDTNGDKISLLTVLEKTPVLDQWVYLGKEAKIPVRLVAIPVPEKVANQRRRRLLKNKKRDRRLNPGKEQLALCGWSLFICNVPDTIWSIQEVSNAYGIRWRIEIIFKAWKSHFNLTEFTNGSKEYVQILLYVRLIFILLFQLTFVRFDKWIHQESSGTHLSLLKFAQFVSIFIIMALGSASQNSEVLMLNLQKHCVYEKRINRISYGDIMQIF